MKLLKKFRRDESPLRLPLVLGPGVSYGDGGVWAWVEIPPRSTDELDADTLIGLTRQAAGELTTAIPVGAEFHMKIAFRSASGDDYRRQETTPGMTEGQRIYVDLGADRIDDLAFPQRMVLLGVRMDAEAPGNETVTAKARRVTGIRDVEREARSALDEATMGRILKFQQRMASSSFAARPATPQQLAWALCRDLRRVVPWIPEGALIGAGQMRALMNTYIVPAMNHVEVGTDVGPRFLRMLTVAENGFPTTGLELPGDEWLRDLTAHGDTDAEPVEVSIRGRNVPKGEALKRLKEALLLAKGQVREARQGVAEDATSEVVEARDALDDRIAQVSKGLAMIEDSVTWVVEADNLDDLDTRTTRLVDHYHTTYGITLWSPPGDQDLLFRSLILGDVRRVSEFDSFRPATTLLGGWFHGGSSIGEETGPFLAQNLGSTPGAFRCRLSNAQLDGDGIVSAFVGSTGAGKSTAVELAILAEAVLGALVVLVDMKGDLQGFPGVVESFGVEVTRVSTADISSGALDPFRYVTNHQLAADMAIDNLMLMCGLGQDPAAEQRIRRAANKVVDSKVGHRMSTNAIITTLLETDGDKDAQDLGERLLELSRTQFARPVAGVPDLLAPHLSTRPGLVYFLFEGLALPGAALPPEQYKPQHRLSMMLVQAGFQFAAHVASSIKGVAKVLALTEIHLISGLPFGKQLIGDRARMGRAQDVNLLLDTQAAGDLLVIDGLVDQITALYAFRARTDRECDAQAALLGMEPSAGIRSRQKARQQGECLAKDRAGNVAPIRWDYLCAEIELALSTKPQRDEHPALQAVPDEVSA